MWFSRVFTFSTCNLSNAERKYVFADWFLERNSPTLCIVELSEKITTQELVVKALKTTVSELEASKTAYKKNDLDQKVLIAKQKMNKTKMEKNLKDKIENNNDFEIKLEKKQKKLVKHLERINFLTYSAFKSIVQVSTKSAYSFSTH